MAKSNGQNGHPKSYSKFTMKDLKHLGIRVRTKRLFANVQPVTPSAWLEESLSPTPEIKMGSEKSKSEFSIAPVIREMVRRNPRSLAVFSGYTFEVDESKGLTGSCDVIFSKVTDSPIIEAPVFLLVEAKNENLESGIPQCIAEMYASYLFNQQGGHAGQKIFGAVTFGDKWRFLSFEQDTAWLDEEAFYTTNLAQLLGVLQAIIDA